MSPQNSLTAHVSRRAVGQALISEHFLAKVTFGFSVSLVPMDTDYLEQLDHVKY